MNSVKTRSLTKWVIIAFWIVMIALSFSAGDKLTGGITNSNSLTDTTTQAGKGQVAYQHEFNISGEIQDQIIVLNTTQNLATNQWRNFTLLLTFYLNQTYYSRNYTQIYSEPTLLLQGQTNFASSLISKDHTVGLIMMAGNQQDLSYEQDVHNIRGNMSAIIKNPTILWDFYQAHNTTFFNNYHLIVKQSYLPSNAEISHIQIILTGTLANFTDILSVAKTALDSSEVIAVVVVLIILAFVFRSPLGLVIPLISMVSALFPTYLVTYILSTYGIVQINDFLPAIIAMIGIAVAIDYNLFNLTRYKEEFHKRKAQGLLEGKWSKDDIRHAELESSAIMNKTSGRAVMYSGFAVLTGFLSLLLLHSEFSNGMAIAVSIVIVFSVITARTLTPAILGLFGRYIDFPDFLTRANKSIKATQEKKEIKNIWTRWSNLVMKHALTFLILGIIIIVPVTLLSLQTNLGFDTVKNLPQGTESRDGFEILAQKFDLGSSNPYQILIETGVKNGWNNSNLINKINELGSWATNYSEKSPVNGATLDFSSVSSLSFSWSRDTNTLSQLNLATINAVMNSPDYTIQNGTVHPNIQKLTFMANFNSTVNNVLATPTNNVTLSNSTLLVSITSNLDQGSSDAWLLVQKIRDEVNVLFGPLGVKTYVFGFAAAFYDTQNSMYGNTPMMLTIAVILIFIALMILFRSVLLPAKAIITISGSILFALGSLVWIFQQGAPFDSYSNAVLWLIGGEKIEGITFFIPVFLFTIVLGLGMDYSIFIISRIREEWEKGATPHDAVGLGLSKTANVVTSAATVMIATFIVFALTPILFLKTIGVAMSVAIFVDATVSRMILLPSAMSLAGRWNWYLPKWLKKILPEVKIEH